MKKLFTPIAVAVIALGTSAASIAPAQAGGGHHGHHGHHGGGIAAAIALGIFAGAILNEADKQDRRKYRRHRVRCKYPTNRWHAHRQWDGEGHRHRHCGRHRH